jgi:hypothetical protein
MGRDSHLRDATPPGRTLASQFVVIAEVKDARPQSAAFNSGIRDVVRITGYHPQSHFACPKQGSDAANSEGT